MGSQKRLAACLEVAEQGRGGYTVHAEYGWVSTRHEAGSEGSFHMRARITSYMVFAADTATLPYPFLRKLYLVILRLLSVIPLDLFSLHLYQTHFETIMNGLVTAPYMWLKFVGFIKPLYSFKSRKVQTLICLKREKKLTTRWIENICTVNYHIIRGAAELRRNSDLYNVICITKLNHRVHFTITSVKVSSAAFPSLSGSKCNTSRAFAA